MQLILRRVIWVVFGIVIGVLILLWGVAPLAAKYVLKDFFTKHDAEFVAESISVNPFIARISANNISVTGKRGREFNFDAFHIELDIVPLFKRQVRVAQIGIDGLHVEAIEEESGWRVAGVLVPEGEQANEPEPPSPPSENPWEIHLPSILLNNCTANISRINPAGGKPLLDSVTINRLFISKIVGQGQNWRGAVALSAAVNGATADLSSEFRFVNGNLTQWIDIQLLTAALSQFKHYVPEPLNEGNLNLSLIGEVVIDHSSKGTTLTASTKRLDLDRVSLPLEPVSIESERTQATIETLQVVLPAEEDEALSVILEGSANSVKTRLRADEDRKLLAGWESLSLKPLTLSMQNNVPKVDIKTVEISQLVASQNSFDGKALPALSSLNEVTVSDIAVTDQQAKVDSINISDLDVQLQLDKSRNLVNLVTLSDGEQTPEQTSEETQAADEETSSATESAFEIIVNRLNIGGNSSLSFSDQGVTPAFTQQVEIKSLTVEGLHTGNPEQPLHLVLDAKTDKYSSIKTDTRMWPFKEKLTVDTRTELQEINLHPVSPYVADALGYDIESGQLDLNLTMNIDQGIIDGQTQLNLRKFDLGGTDTPAGKDGKKQESGGLIPLNVAVGMIKDDDQNIELDVPISGDVNSPDFGWGSFVSLIFKNALFEATAVVVAQSFIPYANVLTIAKIAGDQLLKMRVEPLVYPAQAIDPSTANPVFVDEMRKLMTEKKDIQVKACPFTAVQDLADAGQSALTDQQLATLKDLAAQRGEAFKDAMIAGGSIKSSRILLCKPQVDLQPNAQGRLEFEI